MKKHTSEQKLIHHMTNVIEECLTAINHGVGLLEVKTSTIREATAHIKELSGIYDFGTQYRIKVGEPRTPREFLKWFSNPRF